ncbi:MAG: hypothetical protein IPK79_08315 [Vampirovibrionales bacterium]|nr:hypothetical protein [Vampirovibrionales bacterium]
MSTKKDPNKEKATNPMFWFWGAVVCFIFGYLVPSLLGPYWSEIMPYKLGVYYGLFAIGILTITSLISLIVNKNLFVKILSIILFLVGLIFEGGMLMFILIPIN